MKRPFAALTAATLTVLAAVFPFAIAGFAAAGIADPPTVTTADASDRSDTEATVHGHLDDLGNATNATVWFEYWPEGDAENATATAGLLLEEPGPFTASVAGLRENTTYVVVARANASDGAEATGDVVTVTTTGDPAVTTDPPTEVTDSAATLRGHVDDLAGAGNATVWFEYWIQGDPVNATITNGEILDEPGGFNATVSGLAENETYIVETSIAASDGDGETGFEVPFTTESAFVVETDDPTDVSATEAMLHGSLLDLGGADNATVRFEYWQADDPGETTTTDGIERNDTGAYGSTVSGLEPDSTYEVVARAVASDGDEATGDVVTFTTSQVDELSIGISQGAARVILAVTRDGEPVEGATVTVSGDEEDADAGSYTTDEDGTVVIPAPDSTVTVTINAESDGLAGRRTVTLHVREGHGAPFTPFGQRVSAFVDSLLSDDTSGPLGHEIADFVLDAHPDHGPFEDGNEEDDEDGHHGHGPPGHPWGDEPGPPNREDNDEDDGDADDGEDDGDGSDDEDDDELDDNEDDRGPPDHARNDDRSKHGR